MPLPTLSRRLVRTTLIASCSLGLAAPGIATAADDDTLKVGMSFQELNNAYFVVMKEAMSKT